jgi:hypothetical protein
MSGETEQDDPQERWVRSVRWNMMSMSPAGSKFNDPDRAVETHIIQTMTAIAFQSG